VLRNPRRNVIRSLILKGLFTRPRLLRFTGRLLWLYRASGAQNLLRLLQLNKMLPYCYRELERMSPAAKSKFSGQLIKAVERPEGRTASPCLQAVCRISCFPTSIVILSMFFSPTAAKSIRLAFSIVAVLNEEPRISEFAVSNQMHGERATESEVVVDSTVQREQRDLSARHQAGSQDHHSMLEAW